MEHPPEIAKDHRQHNLVFKVMEAEWRRETTVVMGCTYNAYLKAVKLK